MTENKIQNKAQRFWDRTSRSYDNEERGDSKTFQYIIEKVKRHLKPADTVLDLGCGTGKASIELASQVKKIDAIDLSSGMIDIAKKKIAGQQTHNIEFSQATIFDEHLKLASCDVILCLYVLHLLDKPQDAMSRMSKLLKPGGLLISATPCMGEKPIQGLFFSILNKINLVPKIHMFKRPELERLAATGRLSILESEPLPKASNQYFIVAKIDTSLS